MKVSFNGINESIATFYAAQGVVPGEPVKLVDSGKVGTCAANDKFIGIALNVTEDRFASVLLKGYVTFTYTGSVVPTLGKTKLLADGLGSIKGSATGDEYIAIELATTAKTIGLLI